MVVAAIVAVMVAVAMPFYAGRVAKGRQAHAKVILEAARLAMENYRAKQGSYLKAGEDIELLPGFEYSMWQSNDPKARYEVTVEESTQNSFVIKATCNPSKGCNIDGDPTMDTWTLNERSTLINTLDDVAQ